MSTILISIKLFTDIRWNYFDTLGEHSAEYLTQKSTLCRMLNLSTNPQEIPLFCKILSQDLPILPNGSIQIKVIPSTYKWTGELLGEISQS